MAASNAAQALNELQKRNDALNINYPGINGRPYFPYVNYSGGTAQIAITVRGSDWYWTVCAIMIFASMAFVGLSFTKQRSHRIFHYITALVTMVASIAYFSMASNIGWAPIRVQFRRGDPLVRGANREIFYVRYIDWVITTPLLLLDLLLTAGLPWPTILYTVLIDEIMIITGLVGALVRSSYKWGYFTFGCLALVYIGYVLLIEGPKHAKHLGNDIGKAFFLTGTWTFVLWVLYPIAWGVCEGGNVISPDSEAVFYGVLDVLAKPCFGALLLFFHRNIDPSRLGLHIRDYDEIPAAHGSTKHTNEGSTGIATNGGSTAATGGVNNGVTNGGNVTHATTAAPATETV